MINSVLRFLGGLTRFIFNLLTGKYKKLSHFVDPFWKNTSDIDYLVERDKKNWDVGLIVAILIVLLIYLIF